MKAAASLSLIALLATSAIAADMQTSNTPVGVSPAHMRLAIAQSKARREASGKQYKRCKAHNKSGGDPAPSVSAPYAAPSSTPKPADPPAPAPPTGGGGGGGGTITVGGACGDNGAVAKTTKTAGPNGSETFLNCGIEGAGWNPPNLQLHDIKYKNLDEEFANPNSIFKACKQFASNIYDSAGKYDIPPIMVASIMMQESSCNPGTVGGGGEQGLMQITKDKCGGAPGGNCKDPAFNIDKGVSYLAGQIKACNGNVLEAVGTYNGWYKGLTYGAATAAKNSACCSCQNNLDYPHQFFNAWLQGIDAYSTDVGTYKNLNSCN